MAYEIFICRAFKTNSNNRLHKAHISNMTNLFDREQGRSNVAHLPTYQKQLRQVKENVSKAIDKFLSASWRLTFEEKGAMLTVSLTPIQLPVILKADLY